MVKAHLRELLAEHEELHGLDDGDVESHCFLQRLASFVKQCCPRAATPGRTVTGAWKPILNSTQQITVRNDGRTVGQHSSLSIVQIQHVLADLVVRMAV